MESNLTVQLSDIAGEVGYILGYGRTAANWGGWQASLPYVPSSLDSNLADIMSCIKRGLRRFYYPQLTDGGPLSYKWSFLTPERTLQTIAGQGIYDLPDDFAGMKGKLTYQPTIGNWFEVRLVGIGLVMRTLQACMGNQTYPSLCALTPKMTDGTQSSRWQLNFAPIPDQAYLLNYRCDVIPSLLSAANPYPYGGAVHGDTIMQACLAEAEQFINDERGNHVAQFKERLTASIALDQQDFKPEFIGKNYDRSDWDCQYGQWGPYPFIGSNPPTYNGQAFT